MTSIDFFILCIFSQIAQVYFILEPSDKYKSQTVK
jgi:hypothetical protein